MKKKSDRALKITVVLIFFIALFIKISYKPANACSCLKPPPPLEAKERAAAVFSGTVIGQESSQFEVKVNFKVRRVWKGNIGDTVSVITNTNSAACGINFRDRQSYLVYAFKNENQLRTNLCSRTKLIDRASEDLQELGSGIRPNRKNMDNLNNTSWQLYSLNDRKIDPAVTAFFENSRISGNSGCNLYNAAYKQKGNAIKFSPIATTKRACIEQSLQQIEDNYLKALREVYSWQIKGDRLIIDYYDGRNEGTLVYRKSNRIR